MGRGPSVTKEEYDYIKLLIMKGQSTEEICKSVKRSPDTVRCVEYSSDYDDFRATPTKVLRKRRKKENEHQVSVDDICQQEDITSQDDEKHEDLEHDIADQKHVVIPPPVFHLTDDAPVSELSAKDKKELAMYAIDQHYFFLKQLTGVI